MPDMFIFLLKVNAALVLFCLGYYLVLRRLTFYTLNRVYLVTAILFSTIYPKINLNGFAEQHQQLTRPVQQIISNWQIPAKIFAQPLDQPNYWHFAEVIFWMGVCLFAMRLLMQLISLYKLYKNSTPGLLGDHEVRLVGSETSPFSFWKSIFINPADLEPADLKSILQHEQVHVNEWHTLDILLAELSTIFYWFNPGVWLMKKAIRENIEFITDQKILQKGADTRQYQYSMLNVSFAKNQNPIVNHFNISTIKKRIIMMNAKRSSKLNLTRYVIVLPAVITLLLIFSFSENSIAKKSRNMFKDMAISVSTLNPVKTITASIQNNITQPANHLVKSAPIAIMPKAKNADTVFKSGNLHNQFLVIGDKSSDSTIFVLNGVKSTKSALKALDPGKIENINMMSGAEAKPYFTGADSKYQVCFITTKDSETGKKLADKINKGMGHADFGAMRGSDNLNYNFTLTMRKDSMSTPSVAVVKPDNAPDVMVISDDAAKPVVMKDQNVIVIRKPPVAGTKVTGNTVTAVNVDAKPATVYHYNITSKDTLVLKRSPLKMSIRRYNYSYDYDSDNTNINHISDKMIMINGKEATEKDMKKLKAYDIESIDVKTDAKTKNQYGDKAKNGVLFITTKK